MSRSIHVKIPHHKRFVSEESIMLAKRALPEHDAHEMIGIYDGEIVRALKFLENAKKQRFEHQNCQYEIRKLAEALLAMVYKIDEYDKKIDYLVDGINLADEELGAEFRVAQARHKAFERSFVQVEEVRKLRRQWRQEGAKKGYHGQGSRANGNEDDGDGA